MATLGAHCQPLWLTEMSIEENQLSDWKGVPNVLGIEL